MQKIFLVFFSIIIIITIPSIEEEKKKRSKDNRHFLLVYCKKRNKMCMYCNKPKAVSSIDAGDEVVM
jgi:hypothetical protein